MLQLLSQHLGRRRRRPSVHPLPVPSEPLPQPRLLVRLVAEHSEPLPQQPGPLELRQVEEPLEPSLPVHGLATCLSVPQPWTLDLARPAGRRRCSHLILRYIILLLDPPPLVLRMGLGTCALRNATLSPGFGAPAAFGAPAPAPAGFGGASCNIHHYVVHRVGRAVCLRLLSHKPVVRSPVG
eukprot:gene3352-638_t